MQEDSVLKKYLSDNERYADLINGLGFCGRQIVSAEDLEELDSQTGFYQEQDKTHTGAKQKIKGNRNRYRDLIRKTAFGINFAVIGVENQTEVHYLMPARSMGYDVREYERQAAKIRKTVRKKKGLSQAEFLSGFTKDDVLHPCVTFVLFYGDEWDGSKDLYGLLDFSNIPMEFRNLVSNYHVNLVEISKIDNTEVFRTDLKQVFDLIRYSKDKNKLKEITEQDEAYQSMNVDAYEVAVSFIEGEELRIMKQKHEKDGKVNMCQGLREWLEDERAEGKAEGRALDIKKIMKNLNISEERAMDILEIPLEERFNYQEK